MNNLGNIKELKKLSCTVFLHYRTIIGSLVQSVYIMGSIVCIVVPRILSAFHQRRIRNEGIQVRQAATNRFRFYTGASSSVPTMCGNGSEIKPIDATSIQ